MSSLAETSLVQHLVDPDSLATLVREGLPLEMIATESIRPLVGWAVDYFMATLEKAPSSAVVREEYGDVLDSHEIDLDVGPAGTVQWAIDSIKSAWVYRQSAEFNKAFAVEMAEADPNVRPKVVGQFATELVEMSSKLTRRDLRVDFVDGLSQALDLYEQRATHDGVRGALFGIPEVDAHFGGIHPSELAVLAAPPKTGKSFFLGHAALRNWMAGLNVALYTLELSVDTMIDRIACMALGIDTHRWDRGEANAEEVDRVREWRTRMEAEHGDHPFIVAQPELGQRSLAMMTRDAQVRGADLMVVDQLTFVELPDPRKAKHERIGDALHLHKVDISTARRPMSSLIAHQINREGVKAAEKSGKLEAHYMADASEVERTVDHALGLYASHDERVAGMAKLQTLAVRRVAPLNWRLAWRPHVGQVASMGEVTL